MLTVMFELVSWNNDFNQPLCIIPHTAYDHSAWKCQFTANRAQMVKEHEGIIIHHHPRSVPHLVMLTDIIRTDTENFFEQFVPH